MKRYVYEAYELAWGYVADGRGGIRRMTVVEVQEMNARFAPFLARSMKEVEVNVPILAGPPGSTPTGSGR